jgi:hypothetical protein
MFLIDPHMPIPTARFGNQRSVRDAVWFCRIAFCFCIPTLAGSVMVAQEPGARVASGREQSPAHRNTAQRFLSQRGWRPGVLMDRRLRPLADEAVTPLATVSSLAQGTSTPTWSPLGPGAVLTPQYGLVTGRVSSVAVDPADATGNHLYVGTTGGGVWMAQNAAATPSQIVFQPLTDGLAALKGVWDSSVSIGAITVQPGSTGVVLAGTGDPNDALDSYYGAGILRSTDGGSTWSLISRTTDLASGLSTQNFGFAGEGFAGFAWSTANPQIVVAAVSQAYEGTVVNAVRPSYSTQGLYYSTDSGATWHLATIRDASGADVQGPLDKFPAPDGNAATDVVWNPIRKIFTAAVRYHGYYQSADGVIWTRLSAQPAVGLTTAKCPTNTGSTGSIACPIFRGALAVNPVTGDTFAWTVDLNSQDQGLWQDLCAASGGVCSNGSITFQQQWNTTALEATTSLGQATIADGVYNLALAAIPIPLQQVTMVLAGANDLWQSTCPVSQGCSWRNTTNAATCASAQVGPFQHALEWNRGNALEVFVANDSGLWRSMDGVAETGSVCNGSDVTHFQNLNGQFQNKDGTPGSLGEVESIAVDSTNPYSLMTGLGVNGTAGVKANSVTTQWPQILGGFGGSVAIDPRDNSTWYVNSQAGVAIYRCSQSADCKPADFGNSPLITNDDVNGDGYVMTQPAPFLVDPFDSTKLLVGTCRVWRGSADGNWITNDAISPILDTGKTNGSCQGNSLIRTVTAAALSSTSEVLYAGMYGAGNGGAILAGHVISATFDSSSNSTPVWKDLTPNPVSNDIHPLNYYGFDISSVVVDPRDTRTIYVTVEAEPSTTLSVQNVYRSADAGATWNSITSNLPAAPVNALVVDPDDANTVYVATDQGVYYSTAVASCATAASNCWTAYGSGLPQAPVVALNAIPQVSSSSVLVAATYGRGVWKTALPNSGTILSAATASPTSISFAAQAVGTGGAPQGFTITNTSSAALTPTSISFAGDTQDFFATGCTGQSVAAGSSCTIQVTFTPRAVGARSAQMIVFANIAGGQLAVELSGTGVPAGGVSLTPGSLSFGQVKSGTTSATQPAQLVNASTSSISIASVSVAQPFVLSSNSCGTTLAANSSCQVTIAFAPVQAGAATGVLTFVDSAGTHTVQLSGTGAAAATDTLSATSIAFPATASGQISATKSVTISNNGDLPLHITSISASASFQQSSNCMTGVAAHSDCTIDIAFAPTQEGTVTGSLTVVDELGTKTVSLSGAGVTPGVLTVNPFSLSFSTHQPGVSSAPQTVIITNTGGASIANIGFQITGIAAASYSLVSTTCGALLQSGEQCVVSIAFTPSATGPIAAVLAISSSTAGVAAAQVQLNGSGLLGSGIVVTPSILTFTNTVGVGHASGAQIVTITNSTGYPIDGVAFAIAGPFSIGTNNCTGSLAPGGKCTVGILFQPFTTGAATGSLTVNSSLVSTPATTILSGTGFDFSVQPSGSTSVTVSSGQQAYYRLILSPIGAGGTFSFQCGTLPANAFCLFNPATTTVSLGVQGNVEVLIYTSASGATAQNEPQSPERSWLFACAIFLLPLALRRGRKLLLLVALAVFLGSGLTSCTASIGGTTKGVTTVQSGTTGASAGTYTIPVTVTSTGVSHSVTLSLTVD